MDAELQRAIATIRRAGEPGRQALQAAGLIPSPPQFSDGSKWVLMQQSVEQSVQEHDYDAGGLRGAIRAGTTLYVSQIWRLASAYEGGS